MSGSAIIVSLRFNPAFIQTLIAYAKAVRSLGIRPQFLADPAYSSFPQLASVADIIEFRSLPLDGRWTHAIFLNPSVKNAEVAADLKSRGVRILYIYHEPWQMSPSYIRDEGIAASVRAFFAHRATISILRLADQILLPSHTALKLYRKADTRHNPNAAYLPLIFDDEADLSLPELLRHKQYFSFIGKPCRSHGFDQFVRTMRHAFHAGLDARFLIASRFPLPAFVLQDPIVRERVDQLEIRCGSPLASEEMNRCYLQSYCVWNVYRRSTQSGVLPKAFMFGTPVIASRVGSFPEFVEDRLNGRFAEANNHELLWDAVNEMHRNIETYAISCRKTFLRVFYFEPWLPRLAQMLKGER